MSILPHPATGMQNISGIEGVVKWFDPKKGFGFIVGPEGQDIFAHFSCIEGQGYRVLRDGSRVEYDAVATIALHPSATLEVGYSWMSGGAMYRPAPSENLKWFYASLELRY